MSTFRTLGLEGRVKAFYRNDDMELEINARRIEDIGELHFLTSEIVEMPHIYMEGDYFPGCFSAGDKVVSVDAVDNFIQAQERVAMGYPVLLWATAPSAKTNVTSH